MRVSEKSKLHIFASALLVASLAIMPGTAAAQTDHDNAQTEDTIVQTPEYVIVDPSDATETDRGQFIPTGEISSDTTIVIRDEDGNLPGGLTEEGLVNLLQSGKNTRSLSGSEGIVVLTPELVAEMNGT